MLNCPESDFGRSVVPLAELLLKLQGSPPPKVCHYDLLREHQLQGILPMDAPFDVADERFVGSFFLIVLEPKVLRQNTMFCGILTHDVLAPECLRASSLLAVRTVGCNDIVGDRFFYPDGFLLRQAGFDHCLRTTAGECACLVKCSANRTTFSEYASIGCRRILEWSDANTGDGATAGPAAAPIPPATSPIAHISCGLLGL